MKKLNITLLLLMVGIITAFAQIPYRNNMAHQIQKNEIVKYKETHLKPIAQKNNGAKATPKTTMYIDYSSQSDYFKSDDAGFVWEFNSGAKANNVHDSFKISKTAIALAYSTDNGGASTPDSIIGFLDFSKVATTTKLFNYPDTLTIDSIFLVVHHENNSHTVDSIGYKIVGLSATGFPTESNLLKSDFDTTSTSLSPSGQWLGTGSTGQMSFGPGYKSAKPMGIMLTYNGSRQDTFGIVIDYKKDLSGKPSYSPMPFSFYNILPFIPTLDRSNNITQGGNASDFQDLSAIIAQVSFVEPLAGSFKVSGQLKVGSSVSFKATLNDPTATISWDYGDASALGSGLNSSHIYTVAGTYTVTATVTAGSKTITLSKDITIGVNGIETFEAFKIGKLYPNPTTAGVVLRLPIEYNGTANTTTVKVYNTIGAMMSEHTQTVANQINISTVGLQAGMYIYTIEMGGQKTTGKFSIVE